MPIKTGAKSATLNGNNHASVVTVLEYDSDDFTVSLGVQDAGLETAITKLIVRANGIAFAIAFDRRDSINLTEGLHRCLQVMETGTEHQ